MLRPHPSTLECAKQLIKEVPTCPRAAAPTERAREVLEAEPEGGPSAEGRARILVGIGVETRLLRGCTVLIVLGPLLLVF